MRGITDYLISFFAMTIHFTILFSFQSTVNGEHGADTESVINSAVVVWLNERDIVTALHLNSVDVHVKDLVLTNEDVTSKDAKVSSIMKKS